MEAQSGGLGGIRHMDLEGESASEKARATKGEESGRGERESATGKDEPQPLVPGSRTCPRLHTTQ